MHKEVEQLSTCAVFYCCVCFAGLRFSVLVQLPSCRQCTFNVPQCQEIGHSWQVGQTGLPDNITTSLFKLHNLSLYFSTVTTPDPFIWQQYHSDACWWHGVQCKKPKTRYIVSRGQQPHSQSTHPMIILRDDWRGLLDCVYLLLLATVFNNANQQINVYGDDIEVDYRGYEVSFNTQWLEATPKMTCAINVWVLITWPSWFWCYDPTVQIVSCLKVIIPSPWYICCR